MSQSVSWPSVDNPVRRIVDRLTAWNGEWQASIDESDDTWRGPTTEREHRERGRELAAQVGAVLGADDEIFASG